MGLTGGLNEMFSSSNPGDIPTLKIMDFLELRRGFAYKSRDISIGSGIELEEVEKFLPQLMKRNLIETTVKDGEPEIYYAIANNDITRELEASILLFKLGGTQCQNFPL